MNPICLAVRKRKHDARIKIWHLEISGIDARISKLIAKKRAIKDSIKKFNAKNKAYWRRSKSR